MTKPLIDRVRTGFEAEFGRDPEGVWSAPGRVSVSGDHTDLQDGVAFGFAIDERSAVAVARRDDGRITIATDLADERATAELDSLDPAVGMDDWKAYPLGMVWAVVQHARDAAADAGDEGQVGTGLDMYLSTDLPIGGGLASSASICAALGVALRDVWELPLGLMQLADLGRQTEVHAAGASTGIADHVTVLHAVDHRDVFYDVRGRDVSVIQAHMTPESDLVALLVGTGETHRNWAESFTERQEACRRVAAALDVQTLRETNLAAVDGLRGLDGTVSDTDLRRARHVVTEVQRTLELTRLLRTEGATSIGPVLRASQASLRDDYGVSTERINATCELAEAMGAVAARMSGSGLGGSVFVLLHAPLEAAFRTEVTALYTERGWPEPFVRCVSASGGARREA